MQRFKKYGTFAKIDNKINLLMDKPLTDKQRLDLIDIFHASYYDTDQDTSIFATEFFDVCSQLNTPATMPLDLDYLNMEDIYEEIEQVLYKNQ